MPSEARVEAPAFASRALTTKSLNTRKQNLASKDIGQGEPHSKLMSLAVKLRAQGHGVGFIFDMLLSVNGHRCKPPLPEQEIAE